MATPAQIRANQRNARRSTGPCTVAGKTRSASNSLRHGFCSQSVLLPGDDVAEYQSMLDDLRAHFGPKDITEERAVREMADANGASAASAGTRRSYSPAPARIWPPRIPRSTP